MAPSPLAESDRSLLLAIADRAIVDDLRGLPRAMPDLADLPVRLRTPVGSFVSLHVHGALNGCIGSIQTHEPLALAVASHARSAAFADPRFPSLQWADYEHLEIEISILSPLAPVAAHDRATLLDSLRPGVDGLVIAAGSKQAVFLPVVWEQLPSAETFLSQLFLKAGLPPSSWPRDLRAFVFSADAFGGRGAPAGPSQPRRLDVHG